MKKSKKNLGFTLMELLTVIVIIGIIYVGGTNIRLNDYGDKQRLGIYKNEIISKYETVRNNSLIGRGKGDGTIIDRIRERKLDFSLANSGSLSTTYSLTGGSFVNSDEYSIEADSDGFYGIESIKCMTLDGTVNNNPNNGTIILKGDNISLSGGCTSVSSKILELGLFYGPEKKILKINTLNGLIQEE